MTTSPTVGPTHEWRQARHRRWRDTEHPRHLRGSPILAKERIFRDTVDSSRIHPGAPELDSMGSWLTMLMSGCLASGALAQSQQNQLAHPQLRHSRCDHLRRGLEQQQQLNQERLRAEHGWQLHSRPRAPWEERRHEDELRKEFPGTHERRSAAQQERLRTLTGLSGGADAPVPVGRTRRNSRARSRA